MRKLLNTSIAYAIAALVCGVFYREFTRWNGYTQTTALGRLHVHLLVLGTLFFLVLALWDKGGHLTARPRFGACFVLYNAGLIVTVGAMAARGVTQVLAVKLTSGADAALSGIAGLGHIALGVGLLLMLLLVKRTALKNKESK